MNSLWSLALPLFFCCWEAVVPRSSAETSATSGDTAITEMSTNEFVTGSDLTEAIFGVLCTDSSSEEEQIIKIDVLTLAHTSTEAETLALDGRTSPDTPAPAVTTSQARAPEINASAKALVAHSVTNVEATNCSITEIEMTAIIPGTPGTTHSPIEGMEDLSTSEALVSLDPTKGKSHITKMTTSVETLTASTTESATPDATVETPLTTNSTTERETIAKTTTSSGNLVTVRLHPLEETSTVSVEAASHAKVTRAITITTEAGSTMGKAIFPAGSPASVYSPSEVHPATIKNSTPSETFTTDSITNTPFPINRSPLPSVHLTTANSSQETNITFAKVTTSAKTLMAASTARGKPPTAWRTTARTRQTTKGGDEGFFLVRLSVASQEDLTDPRVAERLMQQLLHELHAHMPPVQVSLLWVRRS
ncbi:mucin-20 isoform X2 [Tamandua tetradactyla]|uniref:mucin-20 isoform X2 n=1 Tax=Tamandua tetradactyla TaxID=48850 RepID=UPI0040546D38